MSKELFNIKKRLKSFSYAFKGLRIAITEPNMIIHGTFALFTVVAGFIFNISKGEWIAIVLCCGLVLSAETFNTAMEVFVDMISPSYNKLAGQVKDLASAATFLCAVAAAIVGIIIFLPKFLTLLGV